MTKLYAYLHQVARARQEPSSQDAFQATFGMARWDAQRLRHVMSYLSEVIEDFILWKIIKPSPDSKAQLLREYQRRRLNKPFEMLWTRLHKQLEKAPLRDAEHHRLLWHTSGSWLDMHDPRTPDAQSHIQASLNELDHFYLVEKLKSSLAAMSHQRMFKVDYDLGILEEVLNRAAGAGVLEKPEIRVYFLAFKTLSQPQEEHHFQPFLRAIQESKGILPLEQEKSLLLLAINYCIGKMNQGLSAYGNHALGLYRQGLESGLLLENGEISPYTYRNICSAALLQNEYDWAQLFLEEYKPLLPTDLRDSYYTHNLARLHLKQKKFHDVVSLLNLVYVKDIFTQLATRVIHIQAGYEQGDKELVEYQLDNFQQALRRKEVQAARKRNYGNFVKLTRRLVTLEPGDIAKLDALEKMITETQLLVERTWLLEKVTEIRQAP